MSLKKSPLQIIAQILTYCTTDTSLPQLMFKTNLTHRHLSRFLEDLCNKGFIKKNNEHYVATSLGLEFLKKLKRLD